MGAFFKRPLPMPLPFPFPFPIPLPLALAIAIALVSALFPLKASSGTLVYDAGVRASIYDENYKLGLGTELGIVKGLSSQWDAGAHFNYSRFRNKNENWTPQNEFGGRITVYYLPKVEQIFSVKLGPHLGYSQIRNPYLDLGGDLFLLFPVRPSTQIVAAFIPSFFIGKNPQPLFRVGLGMQYSPGL